MMVPGALIMMLLEPVPEKGSSLIIWSILCYLVGLIYHCIIEYLLIEFSPSACCSGSADCYVCNLRQCLSCC